MPVQIVDAERERRIRDLRLRIGRLRRRIDRRANSTGREARRLLSWRTYVKGYPGNATIAALGAGLALSAGLSTRRLARWLGLRLIRRAADQASRHFWRELQQIWADSSREDATIADAVADHNAGTTGPDDDRA